MRWTYWLFGLCGLFTMGLGSAQQPGNSGSTVTPWANKFFLPDIAINREQTPPAVIVHNFGDVPHGTLCTHTFTITNIYDVPMQMTDVRTSCTCLDFVPMSKVLQPNESGTFIVTMNTAKFAGSNSQKFYVTFGPKYISSAVIQVDANSRTDISLLPGVAAFGSVAQGAKSSQTIKLEYKGRMRDWKITEVLPVQGPFEVQVNEKGRGGPLRGGVDYEIIVKLKPAALSGPIFEQVSFKTNDPANPLIHIAVTGSIAAPIDVAPAKVRMDAVQIGESATVRVSLRAGKPFKCLSYEGAGAGLSVEIPSGSVALPYQVINVKFEPIRVGLVVRDIRIKTDLDGGAIAIVPVEAEAVK